MKIKEPVFVCGFTRGGTTILMNIMLSHPKLCKPGGETSQLFKGRRDKPISYTIYRRMFRDIPVQLLTMQNFFNPHWYGDRKKIGKFARKFIDSILFSEMISARGENENRYKDESSTYSKSELIKSRLVAKNVNGIVFASKAIKDIYPEARFVCMARNGLAICEGHIRRGSKVDEVCELYEKVGNKMLKYDEKNDWFKMFKFEDIISNPKEECKKIFRFCNLEAESVDKIRVSKKPTMHEDGRHYVEGGSHGDMVWYDIEKIKNYYDQSVNKKQIKRLDKEVKKYFLERTKKVMKKMGYQI